MSKKKPVVALIYDFDGTLSPLNMQEYDFLKAIGIKNKTAFWKENNELIKQHEASNILCYMKLMIDKAHAARVSIKREQFVEFGKSIELYKGVEEWFDLINQIGKKEGVIMANKFANMFVSGGLKVPEKILKRETFRASKNFSAPRSRSAEKSARSYPASASIIPRKRWWAKK